MTIVSYVQCRPVAKFAGIASSLSKTAGIPKKQRPCPASICVVLGLVVVEANSHGHHRKGNLATRRCWWQGKHDTNG